MRMGGTLSHKGNQGESSRQESVRESVLLLQTDGTAIVKSCLHYFLLVLTSSPPCAGWVNRFLFAEFILCNNKIILILNVNFKKRNWFLASEISINWDHLQPPGRLRFKKPSGKNVQELWKVILPPFLFSGHNLSPWPTHPILPLVKIN